MKILLISDYHRGFSHNTYKIHEKAVRDWPEFDVLICAGDMATNKISQLDSIYKFLRKVTDKTILCVLGNHDKYWDHKGLIKYSAMIEKTNEILNKYKIQCLSRHGFACIDQHLFVGVDGMYSTWGITNDNKMAPKTHNGMLIEQFLWKEEQEQIETASLTLKLAPSNIKKKILVTHIPFHPSLFSLPNFKPEYASNPRNYIPFHNNVDLYIYGHTHKGVFFKDPITGCLIANCGADYDNPKHLLIDLK